MGRTSLSIDGELSAGASRDRVSVGGTDREFVTLALDVSGRAAALGSPADGIFLELDASLRFGTLGNVRSLAGSRWATWLSAWLGVALAHRTTTLTVRGALGFAPPLRTLVEPDLPQGQLAGGWGQWDQWLTLEGIAPFGFLGLAEARLGDIDVGGDLALIAAPWFGGDRFGGLEERGTYAWAGVGGWLAGHLGELVRLGLRAQGVLSVFEGRTYEGGAVLVRWEGVMTDYQLSLMPFVRLVLPPAYIELRVMLNLDEPHGPPFAGDASVWAVALRGGASWDP